jgi:hypothetical protein
VQCWFMKAHTKAKFDKRSPLSLRFERAYASIFICKAVPIESNLKEKKLTQNY